MKQYKKYVIPYKSAFILGPIFMIVEVLGEIILPKLMSMIINYGCGQDVTVAAKGPAYIIGIGAAMIGTALLMMMGGVLGAYFAVRCVCQSAEIFLCQYRKIFNRFFSNTINK